MGYFGSGDNNVARYKFTSGALVTDTGGDGNGLDLTNNGSVANANGFQGGTNTAISLNGTTQYLSRADNIAFDFTTLMAVFFRVNPDNFTAFSYICSKTDSGANRAWDIGLGTDRLIRFIISTDGTSETDVLTSTGTLTAGVWSHVACIYNGTDMRIYINGALSCTPRPLTLPIANSTSDVNIGRRATAANYFPGDLDDMSFWKRDFSATEVNEFYTLFSEDFDKSISVTGLSTTVSFGDITRTVITRYPITGLSTSMSFGDMTVDTPGRHNIAPLNMSMSFGELTRQQQRNFTFSGLPMGVSFGEITSIASGRVTEIEGIQFGLSFGTLYHSTSATTDEQVLWRIIDAANTPITGATVVIKVLRNSDGFVYDFNDNIFKDSGWVAQTKTLTEITAISGVYFTTIDLSLFPDGFYTFFAEYPTGTPPQYAQSEFEVRGGARMSARTYSEVNTLLNRPEATLLSDERSQLFALPKTSEVYTQFINAMKGDKIPELAQGQPPKEPTMYEAIMLNFMAQRNQETASSTGATDGEKAIYNDAGIPIAKATLNKTGTTFTKGKLTSGA